MALAVAGSTITLSVLAYVLEAHGSKTRFVEASIGSTGSDFRLAAEAAHDVPPTAQAAAVRDFVRQRSGVNWRISPARGHGSFSSSRTACVDDAFPPGMDGSLVGSDASAKLRHAWVRLCNGRDYLAVYGTPVSGISVAEFYDFQPVTDQLARLRFVLIWVDAGGLAVAAVIGALVGRQIGRPLRRAATSARELGAGDLSVRLPVRGDTELSELSEAFNDMATDLQHAHAQQRQFVSDVSHELRTPLSAMLAAADGMSGNDPDARGRAEELLVGQTRRLASMVDDLLEISAHDAGRAELIIEQVDLVELSADVVRTVAPYTAVEVRAVGDPGAWVDARRVHSILRNLVGNAVQHGRPPIEVLVDGSGGDVVITVSDGGSGIDAGLAPRVFDRFVRGDTSRATQSKHATTGLGLAIAQLNANLHGGRISLASNGRTAFAVHLPRRSGHCVPA